MNTVQTAALPQQGSAASAEAPRMPAQIPFIIGNEGCERFSFYGMRNILTMFLATSLLLSVPQEFRAGEAKDVYHTFVIGVYFFPLLGGWLADRYFGKYRTIFWLSLVYCAGHACLALFENNLRGFYFGLFLIALGSGGIKPLVSSFIGDQFDKTNRSLAQKVFDGFYWIINFGSFFASLLAPFLLADFGASVAFGVPGVLMFIATLIFWSGRSKYVIVKPTSKEDPHSFLKVVRTALWSAAPGQSRPGLYLAATGFVLGLGGLFFYQSIGIVAALCLLLVLVMGFGGAGAWMQLDRALPRHGEDAVQGVRAVLRLLVLFALVTPFWSLFDQKASTWIIQSNQMAMPGWAPDWFKPATMQSINPLLVMLLIPFNNLVLYPSLQRKGVKVTALRRMGAGIAFTGLAFTFVGGIQLWIDEGHAVSILWQLLPYAVLTFGEVLVSATGLEFAYSQAPLPMKGVIQSFWNLSVTVGNLWVLLSNSSVKSEAVSGYVQGHGLSVTAFQMFFFAGFALLASLCFALYARGYQMQDNYRR